MEFDKDKWCVYIHRQIDNNMIQVWKSIKYAGETLCLSRSGISRCCQGKSKTVGDFKWYYLYDQIKKDGTIIPGAITLNLITEEEAMIQLQKLKETEYE